MHFPTFTVLIASAAASPMMNLKRGNSTLSHPVTGVATFNNYGNAEVAGQQPQQGQNCPSRACKSSTEKLATGANANFTK
jgi:hypothetical protein